MFFCSRFKNFSWSVQCTLYHTFFTLISFPLLSWSLLEVGATPFFPLIFSLCILQIQGKPLTTHKNQTTVVRQAPYSPDIRRYHQKVWTKCAASVVLSFSLQWKSDKSTKHYLTQMLLAINWCYWQMGKNSQMRMKVQGHLMQAFFIEIHQVFEKDKVGYFSNRVIYNNSNMLDV